MENKSHQNEDNKKFIDSRQIHNLYRLSHPELDTTLKRLRDKILQELQQFSTRLLGGLNHLNYLRYYRAFPDDNIRFIFQQKVNASVDQERFEEKNQILNRMSNFQITKVDYSGVSDNCIHQIQQYIEEETSILNFKNICPSGSTFLNLNKSIIDVLMPYWGSPQPTMNLQAVFKQSSGHFPKDQMKKLGEIFAQTDKRVLGAKLVFRASQHNFNSAAFKQYCVGVAPSLMLAKSQKGMIFGGFTPCKWLKTKDKQFVSDPNAESFLFSLTKNIVFPIKSSQKDYAISAYGGWGPIYGSPYGPDLSISDKCHINDHSCSSLGSHYQIPPNIKQFSNEAFCLLAGSKKFKVVEYQLYQLMLEE